MSSRHCGTSAPAGAACFTPPVTEPRDLSIETQDPVYGTLIFDAVAAGPDNGELVLLLHGFPQTKHTFRLQLPALAAAGYRAVAVDQRGYSPRARPTGVAAYHTDYLTADVLRMADALGAGRFHLVGHDFGAVIGWQVAARHPDRLASYTSLSVGHPLAYIEAMGNPDGEQHARSGYFEWFVNPATDAELGSYERMHDLYLSAGLSAADAVTYAEALGSPEAIGSGLNWYRASGLHQIAGLSDVEVPTMLIWSTEDPALGSQQAVESERYVNAPYRFEVIEGVDHWIPEHAPDRVNALLVEHLSRAT
jgi:pimeloyl-ACP methyl ester carboxylesterase